MSGIDEQCDVDLMDVRNLAKENRAVKYILLAIDIFSMYVFAQPPTIMKSGRKPRLIHSDKGLEFVGKQRNI